MAIWVFSNNKVGYYEDTDWDTSAILRTNRYYFKSNEPNRGKAAPGDKAILREYGRGLWGMCEIVGEWVEDPEGLAKHEIASGWFPITTPQVWSATLPYELVKEDISNQNHRLRIAKATETDLTAIQIALRVYSRLGYGATDGDFFVLESGMEEAVKANLKQLGLRLADKDAQQQCSLAVCRTLPLSFYP